jgi:tetratricopeptide (TPR) repeat protein
MEQGSSEKANVAWFKLAEFVGRGEKERALGLYRLLVHSLDDLAFIKKLEAELFSRFDMKQAEHLYVDAALLYQKAGQPEEAALIYEHLIRLQPKNCIYVEKLILYSHELGWEDKVFLNRKKLSLLFLEKGKIEKGLELYKSLEKSLKDADKFVFYQMFTLAALTHKYTEQKTIKTFMQKALDSFLRMGYDKELQQFIAGIKALNTVWHKDAVDYLKK